MQARHVAVGERTASPETTGDKSIAICPAATGHHQKRCMQSGAGAPQMQGSALCRRAAVGIASKVRRQYTSLCWLVQGSRHSCGGKFLRKAIS